MKNYIPARLYVEKGSEKYQLGKELIDKYSAMNIDIIEVDDHNNIPEMRQQSNKEFPKMKDFIVLGIRKSLTHRKNNKTSDFLVPYTSSGCTAMCLYCYLVCTYYKCSYLRIFVNREKMMEKLKKAAVKYPGSVFEIGSNSDLILENAYSGNLEWTIREFANVENAQLTLPTKFDMVDTLLDVNHGNNVTIRMSLNPQDIIQKIEFRTSNLNNRIKAINKLYKANYDIGILIAPIILIEGFEDMYEKLLKTMSENLLPEIQKTITLEIIFMTYGTVTKTINDEAFPNAIELYNQDIMSYCGRSRYGYTPKTKENASTFLRDRIAYYLPDAQIAYIV